MLIAIVAAVLAYRKANDTGRNGILWAFVAVAVFIGTQLVTAVVFGAGLGLFIAATGRSEADFDKFQIVVTILAIVASLGSTWLLLRYLDKVPEQEVLNTPPPPPENFR